MNEDNVDSMPSSTAAVEKVPLDSKKKKQSKKIDIEHSIGVIALSLTRAKILLIRSAVAALGTLSVQQSNFMHPYAEKILMHCIPLGIAEPSVKDYDENDSKLLTGDINRCLIVTVSSIPARLIIPALGRVAKQLQLGASSGKVNIHQLLRFVGVLEDYWRVLDRNIVTSNISLLGSLAMDVLSYRWACGVQSELSQILDDKVSGACVQLCLKFTEAEVRTILAHAAEWAQTSPSVETDEDSSQGIVSGKLVVWTDYSKLVSFFHYVSALNEKMRSIFTPCMVPIWPIAAQVLGTLSTKVKSNAYSLIRGSSRRDNALNLESKSAKKRRREADEPADTLGLAEMASELVLLAKDTLSSIKTCCLFDKSGFVDEVQNRFHDILNFIR